MRRRAWLRGGVALAVSAPLALLPRAARAAVREARRQLRFRLTLVNPYAKQLGRQTLWAYLPAGDTGTQRLLEVSVSAPHRLHTDTLGHTLLELSFAEFPPLGQKTVDVSADLLLRSEPESRVLSDPRPWLGAERFIEADEPRIRALAARLARATDRETARAVYDWVSRNLAYEGYVADDRGALWALTERKGDCTEYAYLAVALARACGIPSRMVGGYVTDRNAAPRPEEYHDWAEVYLEGAWRLLDAQKLNWLAPAEHYVAFHIYRDASLNPAGRARRYKMEGDLQVGF